jgi:hypothetical protein
MRFSWSVVFALVIGFCGGFSGLCFGEQSAAEKQAKRAVLQTEWQNAVNAVQRIVNQPVTRLPRTKEMRVADFGPVWFHNGAVYPDFMNVDVRKTRETTMYDKHEYVTSKLNPGIVFIGRELEFNPMTKAFYLDPTFPKKKLSETEMLEINRLYRIIGRCEQQLDKLR